MRISDWSSDVCSSALVPEQRIVFHQEKPLVRAPPNTVARPEVFVSAVFFGGLCSAAVYPLYRGKSISRKTGPRTHGITPHSHRKPMRSEEHTSELQSLMSSSYAVFCLKKKNK